MDIIKVLPEKTAQLIAAGEVVENPASVVKELVENSIDAGAKNIRIEISGGGIDMIRVSDNGKGMSPSDAVNCFLRHATSKVSTPDDIGRLITLGFRGEALASIAAVSKVRLITRTHDDDYGVTVQMDGGKLTENEIIPCNAGTSITVKELFYNTPARKKFLKSERAETSTVAALIDRLALSHSDISFKFSVSGKEELFTPGDGSLKSAIIAVWGAQTSDKILEVIHSGDIAVNGFVSKPLYSKGSRHLQLFYINGRIVSSKLISSALEDAYKNSIMVGKFPACVLNITLSPDCVDVNVHPSKSIVKFSDDKKIYTAVYNAVQFALSSEKQQYTATFETKSKVQTNEIIASMDGFTDKPSIQPKLITEKEKIDTPDIVIPVKPQKQEPVFEIKKADADMGKPKIVHAEKETPKVIFHDSAKKSDDGKNKTIELDLNDIPSMINIPKFVVEKKEEDVPETEENAPIEYIGEVLKTYVIAQSADEVYIIDKHAAHERLIFEELKKNEQTISSQMLLLSLNISMDREDKNILLENAGLLARCGFEIEDAFRNTVSVKACPDILANEDAESVLLEIAESIRRGKAQPEIDKINKILEITSCKAAIKAGQNNGEIELKKLVNDIFAIPDIKYCPHGRPIIYTLTRKDFDKFFKRIV